jgi:glycosyltransferase involved in cell wall biosynthesis
MPAYNEDAVIETVLRELDRAVMSKLTWADALVIDDASADGTGSTLDRLTASYRWLRVEHAPVNRGHGPSISEAIDATSGDWVFQLDADRQFDIDDFWRLWERRDAAELVLGVRRHRRGPRHRLFLGRVVSSLVSLLARRRLSDPNTPFRLFRRTLWRELEPLFPDNPLAPSILLALGATVTSQRIIQVPVTHRPRAHGQSSLRAQGLVVFCLRAALELLAFRARLAFRTARGHASHFE